MPSVVAQAQDLTALDSAFVRLVDQALANPALLVAAAAAAFGVGAVHALAPGHGKAIAAAYLVGGRGRYRDAVLLGAVVAAMHTVSVVVLAVGLQAVLRSAGAAPASVAQVTPGLRIASGVLVVGLGAALLVSQWRRRRGAVHGHDHDEFPPEVRPFSRRGLVLLGASGGLVPSPSAFLVLVTTIFTGRLFVGLLLVGLFSLGLAATLTAIGLAVVRGRAAIVDRLSRQRQQRLTRVAAVGGAVVIVIGGVVLTAAGLAAL